jgi:hypothetical protein
MAHRPTVPNLPDLVSARPERADSVNVLVFMNTIFYPCLKSNSATSPATVHNMLLGFHQRVPGCRRKYLPLIGLSRFQELIGYKRGCIPAFKILTKIIIEP